MKKILVAGGAGFIGSHLVDRLIEDGHQVFVVDSLITGNKKNLTKASIQGTVCYVTDIFNYGDMRHFPKMDEIYNLASPASPMHFSKMPIKIMEAAMGHYNLLDMALKWGAKILFTSTSEVYGDAEVHPQVETYNGNVNTTGVRSAYDEGKRFGEALTAGYRREHGLNTKIVRIFNTYGPRMDLNDGRIIPNFFKQAMSGKPITIYGDGKQTRSFCYVSDLVDGLVKVMGSDAHGPFNLGNPQEKTVLEVAEVIKDIVNPRLDFVFKPLPEHDPKQRCPNIDAVRAWTGWNPTVSFDEGISKTYADFRYGP